MGRDVLEWEVFEPKGGKPLGLSGKASFVRKQEVWMYGGLTSEGKWSGEMHVFDFLKREVRVAPQRGTIPPPTVNGCHFVYKDEGYIYGGYLGSHLFFFGAKNIWKKLFDIFVQRE